MELIVDTPWIKGRFAKLKITQVMVGTKIHVDRSVVSRIINGEQPLKLSEAVPFSQLLDTTVTETLKRFGLDLEALGEGVAPVTRDLVHTYNRLTKNQKQIVLDMATEMSSERRKFNDPAYTGPERREEIRKVG